MTTAAPDSDFPDVSHASLQSIPGDGSSVDGVHQGSCTVTRFTSAGRWIQPSFAEMFTIQGAFGSARAVSKKEGRVSAQVGGRLLSNRGGKQRIVSVAGFFGRAVSGGLTC